MKVDVVDTRLRYFLKIAQFSSLSKAASEIGISQSGLSRQLALLESLVGKPLFERTGRGVRLTDAGERLRAGVQAPYEQIDSTLAFVRERAGITEGKLRTATTYTIGLSFVSPLLDAFISRQTGISLSVTTSGSPGVLDLVERKRADIGFLYDSAVASDRVDSVPLFDTVMCLVARRGEMEATAEVDLLRCRHPLVSYPKTYALREMLRSAGLEDRIVAEANTLEVILRLVASGVGRSILPERIPDRVLDEYGLIKVRHITPRLTRRVVAIVRSSATTPLARELFDMARDQSDFNRKPATTDR